MAKNTNRAASAIAYVAALVLATGAWAAHWEMYSNNPVTYAKEIFGGDDPGSTGLTLKVDDATTTDDDGTPLIIEDDEGTSIDLKLYLPNDGSASVGDGSELEVTFSLKGGARFGQAVNWTDIVVVGDDFAKVGGSQKDGRRDDASVTLKVMYGDEDGNADAIDIQENPAAGMKTAKDTGYFIRFDLGSIQRYAGVGSVTASAEFRVTDGPDNNFPAGDLVDRDAVKGVAEVLEDNIVTTPAVVAVIGTSGMVARSAQAVTFTGADGVQGNIDLVNRANLDGATQVAVGSISHTPNNDAVEADGKTVFADGKGMDADIHIRVEGSVRDTDMVYFDLPDPDDEGKSNKKMDDKEDLSITDGVATGSFRLTNGTVYYVPDGETPMSAGDLEATFTVEYDASSVKDPGAVKGGAELKYSGVDQKARAYAIPNLAHADEGNVRIKCEETGDTKCTVFLDCNEQDGTPRFGELDTVINAGATRHMTSEAIAGLFEDLDDWTGRLSCNVLSAHDVSVQVLVRSEGSLINNTYVDGGN